MVGLAHSGWKGTVGRIAGNVVEAMVDDFGSDVRDIVAVVGPGIGPCCYSVGENVIEAVEGAFMNAWGGEQAALLEKRDGLVYFNLRRNNPPRTAGGRRRAREYNGGRSLHGG